MRTQLARDLGLEFPIFAFSHCRDVVAAVSRAGGMGVLGALYFTPDELEIELKWIGEDVDGQPHGGDLGMAAQVALRRQAVRRRPGDAREGRAAERSEARGPRGAARADDRARAP